MQHLTHHPRVQKPDVALNSHARQAKINPSRPHVTSARQAAQLPEPRNELSELDGFYVRSSFRVVRLPFSLRCFSSSSFRCFIIVVSRRSFVVVVARAFPRVILSQSLGSSYPYIISSPIVLCPFLPLFLPPSLHSPSPLIGSCGPWCVCRILKAFAPTSSCPASPLRPAPSPPFY